MPVTEETQRAADGVLRAQWLNLRDNASPEKLTFADGVVFALYQVGAISEAEAEGWRARFERCPGHEGEGGRVWCAFCGDMTPLCDWKDEETDA